MRAGERGRGQSGVDNRAQCGSRPCHPLPAWWRLRDGLDRHPSRAGGTPFQGRASTRTRAGLPSRAAVDDAIAAYRWLLAQGYKPERIVIAGDSAGGGLTVATLIALRDIGV